MFSASCPVNVDESPIEDQVDVEERPDGRADTNSKMNVMVMDIVEESVSNEIASITGDSEDSQSRPNSSMEPFFDITYRANRGENFSRTIY